MFETSPSISRANIVGSSRSPYNETILENSEEQDSPLSASKAIDMEPVAVPGEAMRLIMKNPAIVRTAEEHGINLANLATDMVLMTYKKGDIIIDYGDTNNNFYILKKGTLKLTECEPGSSSFGQPCLNSKRILNVHYVSEEG